MKKIIYTAIATATALFMSSCCNQPEVAGSWNIVSVNGTEVTLTGEEAPFMEFNTEENKIHGFTGCNIMNGQYTLEGKELSFGNVATTMMAGSESNMKLEREVLDGISKAAEVKADGENLQILDAENNVLLVLKKK